MQKLVVGFLFGLASSFGVVAVKKLVVGFLFGEASSLGVVAVNYRPGAISSDH